MEIEKMEAKQTEEKQMQLNLNEIEARRRRLSREMLHPQGGQHERK